MFRRFSSSSSFSSSRCCIGRKVTLFPCSNSFTSSVGYFHAAPDNRIHSSVRFASTVAELVAKLDDFKQQYAVNKSAILKSEAAELVEKEVLSDAVPDQTSLAAAPASMGEENGTAAAADGGEDASDPFAAQEQQQMPVLTGLLAPPPKMKPTEVATILSAAAQFGVQLQEPCHAVSCAARWAMSIDPSWDCVVSSSSSSSSQQQEEKLTASTCARIVQSLIGLQHPDTCPILVSLIPSLLVVIPETGDASSVVQIAHGYGRTGTVHQGLIRALEAKAGAVLSGTSSIAQVANAFYAFAQLGSKNKDLYAVLSERAVALLPQATPIVIATIVDSVAASGMPQPELIAAYEPLAVAKMSSASAPLVASLMLGFARVILQQGGIPTRSPSSVGSGSDVDPQTGDYSEPLYAPSSSASSALDDHTPVADKTAAEVAAAHSAVAACPVLTAGSERVQQIADSFDPGSVAKLLQALVVARMADENILTLLADRVVAVADQCKVEECASILRSIAQFELYDDTLFGILARRVMHLMRGGRNRGQFDEVAAAADQVASCLTSFAMVSQPHPDLFSACVPLLKFRYTQLDSPLLVDLMWSFVVLGESLRHETLFGVFQQELQRRLEMCPAAEKKALLEHPRFATAMGRAAVSGGASE